MQSFLVPPKSRVTRKKVMGLPFINLSQKVNMPVKRPTNDPIVFTSSRSIPKGIIAGAHARPLAALAWPELTEAFQRIPRRSTPQRSRRYVDRAADHEHDDRQGEVGWARIGERGIASNILVGKLMSGSAVLLATRIIGRMAFIETIERVEDVAARVTPFLRAEPQADREHRCCEHNTDSMKAP
jgi:hypothetical protein